MYRDDIWYRKLASAINERQDDLSDKQWKKYQVDHLLKIANRVRETSDSCDTCQSYQHTLTRLEEEFAELPDSKAQRQYQGEQLREMGKHFVRAHNLAPAGYFFRHWLRLGLIAGAVVGLVSAVVVSNPLLLIGGLAVLGGAGALYGFTLDQQSERDHRLI